MSLIRQEFETWAGSPAAEMRFRSIYRQVVFLAIVLTVWISTRPFFSTSGDGSVPSADPLNQITFTSLALAAILGAFLSDRRAWFPLLQPSYAVMMMWLVVCVLISTQFAISLRAFAFTSVVMLLACSIYVLPERFSQFQRLLIGAAVVTMAIAYFGIVALPDVAKHTDLDPLEPEHAGSWKGHYDHKNIAGAAMASFAIMGLYALRIGWRWQGLALFIGGFVFLYFTKSKTSLGLLPTAILLGFLAERIPLLALRLILCIGPVLLLLVLTLGGALIPEIAAFNKLWMSDPTFTGRFDIWRYGFEMLAYRPWTGYGFEGFWQTSTTLQGESRLELAWEAEKIIHGHNAYLDAALTLGIPGLLIVLYVFLLKPVVDYHRCQPTEANQKLATMFLMIIIFTSLGMCLETYYFRRADPVWFTLLISVLGLRFTAAYRVDQSPSQAGPASG